MRYTLIVGSGKTSRTNVEALLDDYFYINKKDILILLPVVSSPSEGQIYAAQYAKDKDIDVLVSAPLNTSLAGLPSANLMDSDNPIADIFAAYDTTKDIVDVLILWDDDDPLCTEALAWAKKMGVQAQDLTNGMIAITPADDLQVPDAVNIPEQETLVGEFTDDDEDEDDADDTDDLYEALATIVRYITPLLIQEMEKYRK
jgi:hypothetical protein